MHTPASAASSSDTVTVLRARDRLLRTVRAFFHARDYLEVETPIRIRTPALEDHIDAEPAGDCFLRTSPELHMKRLVASGAPRIFQVAPCFRRGEKGTLHHPEYSMLEWYRTETDYLGILDETRDLIQTLAAAWDTKTFAGSNIFSPWKIIPVRQAFLQHAHWDPFVDFDADRFDLDLVEKVEPALPRDVPVVLIDYPAPLGALARLKHSDSFTAERWELYINGIELANAYSELTDPAEQAQRFRHCAAGRRQRGQPVYDIDREFLNSLSGLPPTGGIALGLDRLLMLLTHGNSLADVLPFATDP
jgi:lysyl-tRNA synthetase class 2